MTRQLYIGASGCGKTTTLVKELKELYDKEGRDNFYTFLLTPTIKQDLYAKNKTLFDVLITEFSADSISKVVNDIVKLKKKKVPIIVIDDFGTNNYLRYGGDNSLFFDLIINARHPQFDSLPMNIIGLFQRFAQAPTTFRDNADIIKLWPTDHEDVLRTYKKEFLGGVKKKDDKDRIIAEAWRNDFDHLHLGKSKGRITEILHGNSKTPIII